MYSCSHPSQCIVNIFMKFIKTISYFIYNSLIIKIPAIKNVPRSTHSTNSNDEMTFKITNTRLMHGKFLVAVKPYHCITRNTQFNVSKYTSARAHVTKYDLQGPYALTFVSRINYLNYFLWNSLCQLWYTIINYDFPTDIDLHLCK